MARIVSRIVRWMSSSAWVVTSPMTTQRPFVIAVSQATRAAESWPSIPSRTASDTWSQILSGWPSVTDSDVSRNDRDELNDVVTKADDTCGAPMRRCGAGCPPDLARAAAPEGRRCRRARDRPAAPRAGGPRSPRRARAGCGARPPAVHRSWSDLRSALPRAAAGTDRARAASSCELSGSCRAQHLDAARWSDADVDLVQRGQGVRACRAAVRHELRRVAWARKMAARPIPPQLARQMRADRRNCGDLVAATKEIGADSARHHAHPLAFDEVVRGADVDPAAVDWFDRLAGLDRFGAGRPAEHDPTCGAGGQAQAGDERATAGDPSVTRRALQRVGETLAKRRVHALRTLAGARESCRGRDRGFLFGVAAAQFQPPPSQEVGDDLFDAVLASAVHSRALTFAAARKARSCITLIAPTVEFISAATSFKEYPCRKRSSSTRR